jgi:hypothetical protein
MPAIVLTILGFLKPIFTPRGLAVLGAALLAAAVGVQTLRLNHAKGDLVVARAAAIDTATKRTWQAETLQLRVDFAQERQNFITVDGALSRQSAAVAALTDAGRKATADAQAALTAQQAATAAQSKRWAELLAAKPGPDGCKDADAFIIRTLTP